MKQKPKAAPPKSTNEQILARNAGAIEALESAIKLVGNFNKETVLVRLNNLLGSYQRS